MIIGPSPELFRKETLCSPFGHNFYFQRDVVIFFFFNCRLLVNRTLYYDIFVIFDLSIKFSLT